MSKKIIYVALFVMLLIGVVSLYSTFAYNEEEVTLEESSSDYNLIYPLTELSNRNVSVSAGEEKYLDIVLENIYDSSIKYGMYYYMQAPGYLPDGATISLAEGSADKLEGIIKPYNTKSVSIKILNESNMDINITVGALIGFENGEISDLIKDGEVLIK